MKPIKTLLAVALAATGLVAAADVQAQAKHGWRGGGDRHWGGHRNWGGHRGHFWGPRLGFYIGAPIVLGSYWNSPFWYNEPYVVYRDRVIREPEYVEGEHEPAAADEMPLGEGAPSQGPLYMNYCASAKAYFPKVTHCPEGWKFITPVR